MKMFINESKVTSIEHDNVYALISPRNEILMLTENIEYMKKYMILTHSSIFKGFRVSKGTTKNCRYTHKEWIDI